MRTGLSGAVNLAQALHRATTELLHGLLPGLLHGLLPARRRLRSNPRVVRRKMSGYGVKRANHQNWPQPTLPIGAAIHILGPPQVIGVGSRPRFHVVEAREDLH